MIFKIAVFVVAGIIFLGLIRSKASVFVVFAELTIITVVLSAIAPEIKSLSELLEGFQSFYTVGEESLKIIFKSFAILAIGSVVIDICRDNGEGALAGVVDMVVKILAISCAVPVFTAVIEIALTLFR